MKPKEKPTGMKRKIDWEEGFQEGEVIETWNKKRIGIAILLLMIIILGLGFGIVSWTQNTLSKPIEELRVLGESSQDVRLPSGDDIKKTLENAKAELEKISAENVTASDAAIQKIIKDLQSIQGGGKEPIDVICEMICKK